MIHGLCINYGKRNRQKEKGEKREKDKERGSENWERERESKKIRISGRKKEKYFSKYLDFSSFRNNSK